MSNTFATSTRALRLASNIPLEIFYEIIGYVDNIDIRRNFGMYTKLDLSKYACLEYVTRYVAPEYIIWTKNSDYKKYNMRNLYDFPERYTQPNINKDSLDVQIIVKPDSVKVTFGIKRLKLKTNEKMNEIGTSIHNKGSLDDYFWDEIQYQYVHV